MAHVERSEESERGDRAHEMSINQHSVHRIVISDQWMEADRLKNSRFSAHSARTTGRPRAQDVGCLLNARERKSPRRSTHVGSPALDVCTSGRTLKKGPQYCHFCHFS